MQFDRREQPVAALCRLPIDTPATASVVWCGAMPPRKMGDHAVLGMWVTMQRAARARMELRGLLRAAESGDLEQMEVLPP